MLEKIDLDRYHNVEGGLSFVEHATETARSIALANDMLASRIDFGTILRAHHSAKTLVQCLEEVPEKSVLAIYGLEYMDSDRQTVKVLRELLYLWMACHGAVTVLADTTLRGIPSSMRAWRVRLMRGSQWDDQQAWNRAKSNPDWIGTAALLYLSPGNRE
jgi:hypothetical protein